MVVGLSRARQAGRQWPGAAPPEREPGRPRSEPGRPCSSPALPPGQGCNTGLIPSPSRPSAGCPALIVGCGPPSVETLLAADGRRRAHRIALLQDRAQPGWVRVAERPRGRGHVAFVSVEAGLEALEHL